VKRKSKIALAIAALLLIAGGVWGGFRWSQRNLVTVQTAIAARGELVSVVTASGEIKPRNYINLGANAQGPITDLLVKEGDRVRKGQVVARIEHIQPQADVQAQRAAVASALADSAAAEAGLKAQDDTITTAQATLDRFKYELERQKLLLARQESLWREQLIAKQDYEQKKADYDSAEAAVRENAAHLAQMQSQRAQVAAQLASAQRRVAQAQAGLTRLDDVLARFDVLAPLDGVVTNLPVRQGETVVPGIQNSPASTIMTIADMSLITAEVKVDETDIVNIQLGQVASVTLDAMPNRKFTGKVIEIGNSAILRSTGLAASQSTTSNQEAKDFKVVVALSDPPEEIRPGLSCTAKVTTATRHDALMIPIQALTVRKRGDLEAPQEGVQAAAPTSDRSRNEEVQGVFIVVNGRAEFREVETGIAGVIDIEVLTGLQPGDQIVTGSYKAIRTIRNAARVKVDNRTPLTEVKG
jgi:HlyD family secretion protein